jgi:PAS domain S-box-containing protein
MEDKRQIDYRELLEEQPHGISYVMAVSGPGSTFYISPQIEDILGYRPESLRDQPDFWRAVIHPKDRPAVEQAFARTVSEGAPFSMDYRLKHSNGGYIWLREEARRYALPDGCFEIRGFIADINEQKRHENLSAFRERLLGASGLAAERILNSQLEPEAFHQALGLLGEAARVSRVYIFQTVEDRPGHWLASQRYEWCAAGVEPQIDNPHLQNIAMIEDGYARWIEYWLAGRTVYGLVEDFPESERELLEAQSILSMAVTPIFSRGKLWGMIGFDDCEHGLVWTDDTVACLGVSAKVLGAAFDRMELQQRSARLEADYQGLVDSLSEVVFRSNLDCSWSYLSPAWETTFGYPAASSLGLSLKHFLIPEDAHLLDSVCAELRAGKRTRIDFEGRMNHASGEIRWVALKAQIRSGVEGQPVEITGTLADITDRKSGEQALRQAREAAESANRAKSEFLAMMSHELRTPLNAVLGLTESLLESSEARPEREWRYLQLIHRSGQRLLEVINDVLDLARVDAGRLQNRFEQVSLGPLCAEAVVAGEEQAKSKGISIATNTPSAPIQVLGDPRLLRRMIDNLVSNALKFTQSGGSVEIDLLAADGQAVLRVSDTGIGIPPDQLNEVFLPFTQLDSSLTRSHGGTGLGLALVNRLAALHGGSISVESEVGYGSVFTLTLPLCPAEAQHSLRDHAAQPNGRRSVVLVDDDPVQHQLVGEFLEPHGYQVFHAYSAEECRTIAGSRNPGLIIADLQMPGEDGLELIRSLRRQLDPSLPVIALTALAMPDDAWASEAAGANVYMAKPFKLVELLRKVERWCGATSTHTPD